MRKPPAHKPATSLWLIERRKAAGWKPGDVAREVGVSEDTVRGWEAGRGIGAESLARLEAVFGQSPDGGSVVASGDLIAALTRQAEATERLVDRIDALLASRDRDLEELARTLAALLASPATLRASGESPDVAPSSSNPGQ